MLPKTAKALEQCYAVLAEDQSRVTPWEKRFIDDLYERWVLYGAGAFMSPKQALILARIHSKLTKGKAAMSGHTCHQNPRKTPRTGGS
jgi:hypothetical protein